MKQHRLPSTFLVSPTAMAQRLVRAKTKIREAGIPFRIPERNELPDRLESVLDSIYAGFAEGWVDATGADPARRELAGEAIFLGRMLSEASSRRAGGLGLAGIVDALCRGTQAGAPYGRGRVRSPEEPGQDAVGLGDD